MRGCGATRIAFIIAVAAVAPQVGLLSSLGVGNDIGPRNGKPDYFVQAGLLVGVSF